MTPPASTSSTQTTAFAPLTEADIKAQTDSGSFSRGRAYFRSGHIRDTVLREAVLEARCEGSAPAPYRVQATLAPPDKPDENPRAISCTCPRGGFCKHIVALLLTWIHDPDRFVARPPVRELLGERSREELIALVERMLARDPGLESLVELPMPVTAGHENAAAPNEVTVDAKTIRRQVRSAFADVDDYDDYGWDFWGDVGPGVPAEIATVLEIGKSYVAAGQWANAQTVLTVVAEETLDVLPTINDESGEIIGLVVDADAGLAAALDAQAELSEEQRLSPESREELLRAIYTVWHTDVLDLGGVDLSQHGVVALIRDATDDERAMVEAWLRQESAGGWSQRAVTGFLADLYEAGGAGGEMLLELYREAELWDDVAAMLLEMDRVDEAVVTARRHIRAPHLLTAFANALIARGEEHAGRAIALVDDLAWETEGASARHDEMLQDWLIGHYSTYGRARDAVTLAEQRFRHQPALRTYRAVRDVATLPDLPDDIWNDLRPDLILELRSHNAWRDLIEIHLDEGDIAAALDAWDTLQHKQQKAAPLAPAWASGGYYLGDNQPIRLAQAAEREFPDRALAIYRDQAEREIARRGRPSYQIAAQHLARVKALLDQHGRTAEWQTLITDLREEHKRLRALREELDNAGL